MSQINFTNLLYDSPPADFLPTETETPVAETPAAKPAPQPETRVAQRDAGENPALALPDYARSQAVAQRLQQAAPPAKNTDALDFISTGLDGKNRQVTFTKEQLEAFSKMADPREAIIRTAWENMGYASGNKTKALDDYIQRLKQADGGLTINWRGGSENGENIGLPELHKAIRNELARRNYEATAKQLQAAGRPAPKEPRYEPAEKGDATPDFFGPHVVTAQARQGLYEQYLKDYGAPAEKTQYDRAKVEVELDARIDEAKKRLAEKYDKLKNGFALRDAFIDLDYQNELKSEIDRIVSETKDDFRQAGLGQQIGDASETFLRGVIDANPLYALLPESVKNQMVSFGVGVEKGVISIAAGAQGAQDFVKDLIEDTVVYGFKQAGVDTSGYEKQVQTQRQARADLWQQLGRVETKDMAAADKAYAEKAERNLRLAAYDIPNWSSKAGQAVPSLALGLATGGESLVAQVIVSATLQATLAGGETYINTNDRAAAIQTAAIAGVQGAVGPVTAKLPFAADLATNALLTYSTGKLAGQSDEEIFQSLVTQTALSGGFRAGNKLHDFLARQEGKPSLTLDEARAAFEKNKAEVMNVLGEASRTSFGENVQALYAKAATALRERLTITDAKVKAARETVRQAARQETLYANGIEPKLVAAHTVLAVNAIKQGYTRFNDFAREMVKAAGVKIKPHLQSLYETYMKASGKPLDTEGVAKFAAEEKVHQTNFESINEFRRINSLPEYAYKLPTGTIAFTEINGQKIFGANTTLGEAKLGGNNRAMREQALTDLQKLGKLQGQRYGSKDTMFLTHAEAESLIKAAAENGGKLPKEVEMYVDRPTCFNDCRGKDQIGKGLGLLVELYSIEKLTVRDSHGNQYIFRPNQAVEVIK